MEFLGHQVGGDVTTTILDNLEKVRNTPRLANKKRVRSFLGLIGYYRDNIPAFAEISAPLTDLLKKGKSEHITDIYLLRTGGIWSWCGGCATSGKRWETIPSGLRQ